MTIGITFNIASSGSPTLAVDGGSAAPIVTAPGSPASVVNGIPYVLLYNAASSSWIVRSGGASGGGVPLGGVVPYTGTTVPSPSYVFANGQCISTTTYAIYWVLVGSPAPGLGSCPPGFFAVIDLRGRSLAGIDNMGGASAAGRLTSAATGCGTAMTSVGAACANGNESHTLLVAELPAHYHAIPYSDPGHTHTLELNGGYTVTAGPTTLVGSNGTTATTSSSFTGITFNSPNGANTTYSTGNNTPHSIVPPLVGINYIIRVL